jgi:hypothetical protein
VRRGGRLNLTSAPPRRDCTRNDGLCFAYTLGADYRSPVLHGGVICYSAVAHRCTCHRCDSSALPRHENFGPVAKPDGSPTDLTRAMLEGTRGHADEFARQVPRKRACPECGRVFDMLDATDADEWAYGHDCEE